MEFLQNEALILFNYTRERWERESPVWRAECIVHYIHRNLREGYMSEKAMADAKAKPKKSGQDSSYEAYMKSMGLYKTPIP